MDWQLPLLLSAAAFCFFVLWKVRPSFGKRSLGKAAREALRAAKTRVETAKSDDERAVALADAGDACARGIGAGSAVGYYLRAMRVNPRSPEIVMRAAKALAARPHALESLLWRRLGAEPWAGGGEAAARAALRELERLYAGPLRNPSRARAMGFALGAIPPTGMSIPPR